MPLYTYRCRECETEFEIRQSFSAEPVTDCPHCATQDAVFRVIQPAGVVFKGSGWYVTDSRSKRDSLTGTGNGTKAETDSNGNGHGHENGNGNTNGNDHKPADTATKAESTSAKATTSASAE